MFRKALLSFVVVLALASAPASPVHADNDFAKALAGLVVGGIILNEVNKSQQKKKSTSSKSKKRSPSQPSAAQLAAKDLQTALNNFGFDAGPVDGQPGKQTKAAVASYQGTLGHPQTGEITEVERQLLLSSVAQERLNPAEAAQLAAANPFGRSGLPAAYRDREQVARAAPAPLAPATPAVLPAAAVPTAVPPAVAAAAAVVPPVAAAAAVPDQLVIPGDFAIPTQPVRSINGYCNNISVLTTTNGGFATSAAMPDAALAIGEQFCLARTFTIADGQKVASNSGATQEQISTLCGQLETWLQPQTTGLGSVEPDKIISAVRKTYSDAGKTNDQMAVSGRICLSEAYRTDDAEAASVVSVLLTAADQVPYSELVGHHLREGFGVTANPAAAKVWMQKALSAVAAGAAPVILPGQSDERVAILSKAIGAN